MSERIAAIVVTYNRKNLLLECLNGILSQTKPVDAIFLVDNASTDGTPEMLKERGYIKDLPPENLAEPWEGKFEIKNLFDGRDIEVHYIRMHENTGSSGGFYEGMKRAYEKGYDWLWLMDDDGIPTEDCLKNLFQVKDLPVVGSLVVADDENLTWGIRRVDSQGNFIPREYFLQVREIKTYSNNGVYYGVPNFFNSVLINKDVVKTVGFPKKELFIWGDEVEYALRIKRKGFAMGICINSIYKHPKPLNQNYTALKFYYMFRNTYYIYRLYADILYPNPLIRLLYPFYIFVKFIKKLPQRNLAYLFKVIKGVFFSLICKKLIPY